MNGRARIRSPANNDGSRCSFAILNVWMKLVNIFATLKTRVWRSLVKNNTLLNKSIVSHKETHKTVHFWWMCALHKENTKYNTFETTDSFCSKTIAFKPFPVARSIQQCCFNSVARCVKPMFSKLGSLVCESNAFLKISVVRRIKPMLFRIGSPVYKTIPFSAISVGRCAKPWLFKLFR